MYEELNDELNGAFGFYLQLLRLKKGRALRRLIFTNVARMADAQRRRQPAIFGLDPVLAGWVRPLNAPMSTEEARENKLWLRFIGFFARRALARAGHTLILGSYKTWPGSSYFRGGSMYRLHDALCQGVDCRPA